MRSKIIYLTCLCLALALQARAHIAVLLLEATGTGAARYTSAGHSAVYLSNVCQESPIRLRLCGPGENGSVISNYSNFGESESYEWNVAPVNVFLYGVEDVKDAPIYADGKLRAALEERYRQKYLGDLCPSGPCATGPGQWRDMVGATLTRTVYASRLKTTLNQDRTLIEEFNAMPNVNHYNGFTRNCADFTRMLVNRYFPGRGGRII